MISERHLLMALVLITVCSKTPKSYDWRDQAGVTPVKDQGNCSAGWAFASIAAYQSFLVRAEKGDPLQAKYDLSQQYVLRCSGFGSCTGGTSLRKTMNFLKDKGAPVEAQVPYNSSSLTSGFNPPGDACNKTNTKWGSKVTLRGYYQTSSGWLRRITHNGVTAVGIYESAGLRAWTGSGVYDCNTKGEGKFNNSNNNLHTQQPWVVYQLNHYVALVGYDTSGNFIFKNSHGTTWGNNGYGTFKKNSDCGIRLVSYQFYSPRMGFILVLLASMLLIGLY